MGVWVGVLVFCAVALGNPFPDERGVPKVPASVYLDGVTDFGLPLDPARLRQQAMPVLRVDVSWSDPGDQFKFEGAVSELSGTPALERRATRPPRFGSFVGSLHDPESGFALFYDSTGTGKEMRYLTRAFTFRFPLPSRRLEFRLVAEDTVSGEMREVLRQTIEPVGFPTETSFVPGLEVRLMKAATTANPLAVNIYAEGYAASAAAKFFSDAKAVSEALVKNDFPGHANFEVRAVFHPSNQPLGSAKSLGLPVPERDSFLGLYFPYWHNMERWYNIVYPTRETRFRRGIATVPYDYPIAVLQSSSYWGVGNFNELTAIPNGHPSFTYLLVHELGHYFGLNEEYEGGGPTELQFAPNVGEPWSQNITFLRDPSALKWKEHVAAATPVPTPKSAWQGSGPYGAYRGGYADSEPQGKSHKPGLNCVMKNGSKFCPICRQAIEDKVKYDSGL